ncbi:MAG: PhoH family protein [Planctomycetes bacterium]|nr:PhoH family protein [Planctomycetota bacterium]
MNITRKLTLPNGSAFIDIFGPYDRYLKAIRNEFNVRIIIRNKDIKLMGERKEVEKTYTVLNNLINCTSQRSDEVVRDLICEANGEPAKTGVVSHLHSEVKPLSDGQAKYMQAMHQHDIAFAIGPAGTGKTYLAVAEAISALKNNKVRKIVLCRPAVEAGERLGFLPGDYQAKVNPYLRPLYDALECFVDFQQLKRLMDSEIIEVIPLAYMRGRNLNDAFIILDEAQNTTADQMKMFLTRMGNGSRIIVTGDITQIDLPIGKTSGLVEIQGILGNVKGIAFSYLTRADIIRHPLVQAIVDAYEARRPAGRKSR